VKDESMARTLEIGEILHAWNEAYKEVVKQHEDGNYSHAMQDPVKMPWSFVEPDQAIVQTENR
jgi:hypothetical protein